MTDFVFPITLNRRNEAIELVNQFFRKVNNMPLDGIFRIRPRAATKMVDIYLKLCDTDRVLFIGYEVVGELVALLIARIEDKPYLEEERVLFIDLAVTKNGHMQKGYMKKLVDYTEKWANEKGIAAIELRAITANTEAVDYWRMRGYDEFYIRFRKKL